MGADFWTVPLFHGATLLLAVGLAGYAARRRTRTGVFAARDAPTATPERPSSPPPGGGPTDRGP